MKGILQEKCILCDFLPRALKYATQGTLHDTIMQRVENTKLKAQKKLGPINYTESNIKKKNILSIFYTTIYILL